MVHTSRFAQQATRRRFLGMSAAAFGTSLGADTLSQWLTPSRAFALQNLAPAPTLFYAPGELLLGVSGEATDAAVRNGVSLLIRRLAPQARLVEFWRFAPMPPNAQVEQGDGATFWVARCDLGFTNVLGLDAREAYYDQPVVHRRYLDAINVAKKLVGTRLPGTSGAVLASVSPNWVITTAADSLAVGGPGGPLELPTCANIPAIHTFPTLSPSSPALKNPATGLPVFVLDAIPDASPITFPDPRGIQAVTIAKLTYSPVNGDIWTMGNVCGPLPPGYGVAALTCQTVPAAQAQQHHGTFVTGIINQIAGTSPVMFRRVLNTCGAAFASSLIDGLSWVDRISGLHPAVVNLSLTVRTPLSPSDLDQVSSVRGGQDICKPYKVIDSYTCYALVATHAIHEPIRRLIARNKLIVAAAGNDSLVPPRQPPRPPAIYPQVMGVAAIGWQRDAMGNPTTVYNLAPYSNNAATGPWSRGFATFGGLSTCSGADAVFGRTTTNWGRWVGTSFATPVIAALAANLWGNDPALSPAQVQSTLATLATWDPALQAWVVRAYQKPKDPSVASCP